MSEALLNKALKENPFLLAPMAGISDISFRTFMRGMDASIVTTELVSANGLQYSNDRTRRLMRINKRESPVGIQIFGETLDALEYATKECEQEGADFIDLNFGCPVNKVVKKGAGSAVLKDLNKLRDILRTVKNATSLPVTIKIRTGWTNETKNAPEVAQIAYDEGIFWVAIHGRSRGQAYTGKADWDYIKSVKESAKLPIIGNGDITSSNLSIKRLKESNCDAVMIGRGALKNPWIFRESLALLNNKPTDHIIRDFGSLVFSLKTAYEEYFDERIVALQLKKFSTWFSAGYPGSAKFRKNVFQFKEKEPLVNYIGEYFDSIKDIIQEDTSEEAFLMGGHG